MATLDIFNDDAFGIVETTDALDKQPHKPAMLGEMGIFEAQPIRTTTFSIEKRDGVLTLIPTSQRGEPLAQRKRDPRDIRHFATTRLAKGDVLTATELQGIREFGTDSELMQVQREVMSRMTKLRDDLELTFEYHRLGALQGKVLDADGSTVIYDWFAEWGLSAPAEIDFTLGTYGDGVIRNKITDIGRKMQRAAKGAWTPGTRLGALCGDTFFDKLVANKEIRETYLNQSEAPKVGSSRVDLQACKLEYSIVSPK